MRSLEETLPELERLVPTAVDDLLALAGLESGLRAALVELEGRLRGWHQHSEATTAAVQERLSAFVARENARVRDLDSAWGDVELALEELENVRGGRSLLSEALAEATLTLKAHGEHLRDRVASLRRALTEPEEGLDALWERLDGARQALEEALPDTRAEVAAVSLTVEVSGGLDERVDELVACAEESDGIVSDAVERILEQALPAFEERLGDGLRAVAGRLMNAAGAIASGVQQHLEDHANDRVHALEDAAAALAATAAGADAAREELAGLHEGIEQGLSGVKDRIPALERATTEVKVAAEKVGLTVSY